MRIRAAVLLSGGIDSAAALASFSDQVDTVESVFIAYGQPAVEEERAAAAAIARHYDSDHREISIDGLAVGVGEMRGRNALLAVIGLMAGDGPGTLVLGVHSGSKYWDCGEGFMVAMQAVIDGYTEGAVQLAAPFLDLGKADVYRYARAKAVPEEVTYSCELSGGPCGRCVSCQDVEANARP